MHGLHNHFVIVDARQEPFRPDSDEIVRICDPEQGIGADELIVMEPSDKADIFMRIYNVDGREVEACGNATRCVAWLLFEETSQSEVTIETLAGVLPCNRVSDDLVSVGMGLVSMDWQVIPLAEQRDTLHLDISEGNLEDPVALNVGNPHAVFFVDELDKVDIKALAPKIQANPLFPDGVNVSVAQVTGNSSMQLKVYERGVGLTMACGSGACAAAVAATKRGLLPAGRIDIALPGGLVTIDVAPDDSVTMTGPTAVEFEGTL